jgi:predicted nucleic acid-binding Zn ribbon protein
MPLYVYACRENHRTEVLRQHPDPYPVEVCEVCGDSETRVVIHPSTLHFGFAFGTDSPFAGSDDDFSRRYHSLGSLTGKSNGTQGHTNVSKIVKKWGDKGQPLETRTDIDPRYVTQKPLPKSESFPDGGHVPAPDVLQRSDK